jgi:tryptophanyl-tRNA synthetase
VGTDGKLKMSKSLNNAIFIGDTAKEVKKKIGRIFTGRQNSTDPGDPTNALLDPMRERRARYEGDDDTILDILKAGCVQANEVAEETLEMVRQAASLKFFERELKLR